VTAEGQARLDRLALPLLRDRRQLKRAKEELERRLLLQSASVHTERGSHATVFRTWLLWAPVEIAAEAASLTFEQASFAVRACASAARIGIDQPAFEPRRRR
jgi:hypothetical protein